MMSLTLNTAVNLGLLYEGDMIYLRYLYSYEIRCYYYYEDRRLLVQSLFSRNIIGRLSFLDNKICIVVYIEMKNYWPDHFAEYFAKYKLSSEVFGIRAKFLGKKEGEFKFLISFDKDVYVEFEGEKEEAYIVLPKHRLYEVP